MLLPEWSWFKKNITILTRQNVMFREEYRPTSSPSGGLQFFSQSPSLPRFLLKYLGFIICIPPYLVIGIPFESRPVSIGYLSITESSNWIMLCYWNIDAVITTELILLVNCECGQPQSQWCGGSIQKLFRLPYLSTVPVWTFTRVRCRGV